MSNASSDNSTSNSEVAAPAVDAEVAAQQVPHSAQPDDEDTRRYKVVINHEEQYSIWFADREPPLGWNATGVEGSKTECLAHIDEVWTDMRPLSLRKKMDEDAKKRAETEKSSH